VLFIGIAIACVAAGFNAGSVLAITAMAASFMVSYVRAKSESLGFTPGTGMANIGLAPREVRLVLVTLGLLLTGWKGGIVAPVTVVGLVDLTWWAGRPVLAGTLGLITILATITTIQRILHVVRQTSSKEQE
jgi:phosphatidylglycerophosphate synthase